SALQAICSNIVRHCRSMTKPLKTLRNAQVRRISWVRRVRPARERCEWPPHVTVSGRPPRRQAALGPQARFFGRNRAQQKRRRDGALPQRRWLRRLLDLGFAEFDVLLGHGIVLLL